VGWLSKLSELHIKCATLFERIGGLSDTIEGLAGDLHDVSVRIGRVEGAIINSSTPEVLRQLADLQSRVSGIEVRLDRILREEDIPHAVLTKPRKRALLDISTKPPISGDS
jgi:hypothetical protein